MNDELDLNLDELDRIEQKADNSVHIKNRFHDLATKVKTESQARAEAEAKSKAEADARAQAEKERDFYKSFNAISSKHPEAAQYQDQILERVNKGYDPEEAALAILAKEGKFSAQPLPPTQTISVEGGSAQTTISEGKTLENMSREEKFAALQEMDKSGELSQALRSGIRLNG